MRGRSLRYRPAAALKGWVSFELPPSPSGASDRIGQERLLAPTGSKVSNRLGAVLQILPLDDGCRRHRTLSAVHPSAIAVAAAANPQRLSTSKIRRGALLLLRRSPSTGQAEWLVPALSLANGVKQMATAPRLFISYSWSTPEHEQWVVTLAKELVESGVDVVLDKWDLKGGFKSQVQRS